jgi:hypothetical protein
MNQPGQVYHNSFNQASHDILLNYEQEGGQYVLFQFDKDLSKARCINEKRGDALAAFFISKDRMCILDKSHDVYVSSFDGSNTKKWPIIKKNLTKVDNIYPGPLGKILVHSDNECLFMYDLSARKVLHEVAITDVRRVHWSSTYNHCIVITKTSIYVLNKSLGIINS